MKETKKKYFKGIEELNPTPEFIENAQKEFHEYLPIAGENGPTRRDFLKLLGFGVAAVSLAACETPVKKAIPYVNKPETIDPGTPNYYASTYAEGGDYCSVLVKTREGRPIKIEGNTLSPITKGGTSAQVQASVLSLYDEDRLTGPKYRGKDKTWEEIDTKIKSSLESAASIRIVTNTILSPSLKKALNMFIAKYPNSKVVTYDASSASGLVDVYESRFGSRALPSFDFSKAKTIVSISADFLGTWISPVEFSKQYAEGKKIGNSKKEMSRHYQFESNMTITGASADYRSMIRPSEVGAVVGSLYNEVASKMGVSTLSITASKGKYIKEAAADLIANKGKSLVVCGSNDANVQQIVAQLNALLGNEGSTLNTEIKSYYRQGNDKELEAFVSEAKSGSVDAIIFLSCNPVYDSKYGKEIAGIVKGLKTTISTTYKDDETSVLCRYVCPSHHYLESWGDAMPKDGHYSLIQPTISPIFNTRHTLESVLVWAGNLKTAYDFVKETHTEAGDFDKLLHDGVFTSTALSGISVENIISSTDTSLTDLNAAMVIAPLVLDLSTAASSISSTYKTDSSSFELVKYEKVAIGTGTQANNPWLQECPDPVSKACWDNYASISISDADAMSIKQNDLVTVSDGKNSVILPALLQPGQTKGTIAIAVGYGRENAGKCGTGIGVNIASFENGAKITISKAEGIREIAQTQTHQTYFGRESIIQEATLADYQKDSSAGRFFPTVTGPDGIAKKPKEFDLWGDHEFPNHHWGMVIDLNSCTGCSACVIACHAENNVPVVGRQEVINRRDMHWMRIDRYYSMNEEFVANEKSFGMNDDIERTHAPEEDPEVVFQPMMCQHCNHAGCETVCPVAATTHSMEGLNQMAYNRCVGTRYCANNCAYKVRRFNWFNYSNEDRPEIGVRKLNPAQTDLGKMVLNPDVVVRSRGVMEKCSMCVQRIQYGKLEAKKQGRRPVDEDIITACAQSCPSDAIVFGDLKNPESKISKMLNGEQKERAYNVLEEINAKPNIFYLTKIRNKA